MVANTFQPTQDQQRVMTAFTNFLESQQEVFVLTGAAGSGKTTVLKAIIDIIESSERDTVLLAPTNRASQVLQRKTGVSSTTVHSEIYTLKELKNKDGVVIETQMIPRYLNMFIGVDDHEGQDQQVTTIFIVDEASMISDAAAKGDLTSQNSVLHDLIQHVRHDNPSNKILFVGDRYQLPPIGFAGVAPALEPTYLAQHYNVNVCSFELTEVLRQQSDSPILKLAHEIKQSIDMAAQYFVLKLDQGVYGYTQFIKAYAQAFDRENEYKAIALGWTRRSVLQMNMDVRNELYQQRPEEIEVGDLIYLSAKHQTEEMLLQKGETGKIIEVIQRDGVLGGLLFHTVKIAFQRADEAPIVLTSKILTDFLYDESDRRSKEIFIQLAIERSRANHVYKKSKNSLDDSYMNAIQAKFAYALTVHKAQGGEWENVYLHKYRNLTDLRWNYTAVTRAAKKLFTFY